MDEPPNRSLSTPNEADEVPTLLLSKDEQRVLALYDEFRDLEIKVALIKAQQSHVSGTPSHIKPIANARLRIANV